MRIAVSGATGMVGSHMVNHFAGKQHQVVAVVRDKEKTKALFGYEKFSNLEIMEASLDNKQALVKALAGVDIVIHAAGSVDPLGKRETIFAVNVAGTKNIIEAAISVGAKQFIHISSLSVITGQGDQYNVAEDAPLKYCGEAYADSKIDTEKLIAQYKGQIEITCLRPGFIYGSGERAWMPRLINSIRTGKAMLIDGGTRQTNVIYVGNLCLAAEAALLNPKAYGQTYNLTDGEIISKKDLFSAIAKGLNLPPVKTKIPRIVAKIVCESISTIAPMLPVPTQRKLGRFSRAAFRLAAVNQGFSIAKAQRDLGYTNLVPFAQGMEITLKSFSLSENSSTKKTLLKVR